MFQIFATPFPLDQVSACGFATKMIALYQRSGEWTCADPNQSCTVSTPIGNVCCITVLSNFSEVFTGTQTVTFTPVAGHEYRFEVDVVDLIPHLPGRPVKQIPLDLENFNP